MTRIFLRALNGPVLIFLAAIGIAIQSSLFASWPLSYFQPDIVLLMVVWGALRRGFGEGGILTLIAANISEIHSATPQGIHLISYMAIYLLVRAASRVLVIPSLFSYTVITMVCSTAFKLIGMILLYLLGTNNSQWRHTLLFLFIGAGVEGAVSIWIFRWLEKFDWITYKNARAERSIDEELQLDNEGF